MTLTLSRPTPFLTESFTLEQPAESCEFLCGCVCVDAWKYGPGGTQAGFVVLCEVLIHGMGWWTMQASPVSGSNLLSSPHCQGGCLAPSGLYRSEVQMNLNMLPMKDPVGNSLGSAGHMVPATQLCLGHREAAVGDNINKRAWLRSRKTDLQNKVGCI